MVAVRRVALVAATFLFAAVSSAVSTPEPTAEAAPYPPHNTVVNTLIRQFNKNSCYVSYMHGNYGSAAYATIKRKPEAANSSVIWPTNSTTFPPVPKRFGWGLIYDDLASYAPPWGARCGHVGSRVDFVPWGGSCCVSSSNFSAGFGWTQATGSGQIIGSVGSVHHEDWIYGGLRADRSFAGL